MDFIPVGSGLLYNVEENLWPARYLSGLNEALHVDLALQSFIKGWLLPRDRTYVSSVQFPPPRGLKSTVT